MNRSWILAGAALYGAASVWGVGILFSFPMRRFTDRALRGWMAAGLAFLTGILAVLVFEARRLPFAGLSEAFLSLSWLLAAISLSASGRSGLPILLPFSAPMICLFLTAAAFAEPGKTWESKGGLLALHAGSSLLGYAAFATAFAAGAIYLLQERALRGKDSWALLERLPPLEILDQWNCRAAAWGFPFLTVAMGTGILIALDRGGAWYRDPVVLGSAASWLLFGTLLVGRHILRLAGRRISLLAVAAFGVGLASLGAGLFFGGGGTH